MKKIFLLLFIGCNLSMTLLAQNVGINASGAAPANCAMLDIVATDKGLLVPRVALTAVGTYAPLTGTAVTGLLVFSTSAPTGGNGVGYYYWTGTQWANLIDNVTPGNPWYVGGNLGTTASTSAYGVAANNSYLGTNDNQHLVFATNTFERMRIRTDGEVIIGAVTTVIADDLFSSVSNTTLDWAINGYSGFNGSGIYGQITGGTTIFGAVQGEYGGTNAQGAGVRGLNLSTTNGTSYSAPGSGVSGTGPDIVGANGFSFGVFGSNGATAAADRRVGGVLGIDFTFARGMLGYYSSAGTDFSVYGMTVNGSIAAGNAGKMSSPGTKSDDGISLKEDHGIGLGIYGGVMGGWIKGRVYGTHLSGKRYGIYSDGQAISNVAFTQLNTLNSGERVASYAVTSLTNDLTIKGKTSLVNGSCLIPFDSVVSELIDIESLVVTVSSLEDCKGVFVSNISSNGVQIKEMQGGESNSKINFIMVATIKNKNVSVSSEILASSFEENMNGVLHHEEDVEEGKAIWWDGTQVRFDKPSSDWRQINTNDSYIELYKRKQGAKTQDAK